MYYQLYGAGRPLLLLHGGGTTIEASFSRQLAYFGRDHLIIAPEQMGHGRTPDANRPLNYVDMAENTAELLARLRVRDADVLGWSDGGIVGLILVARHPELVRRLVITGASIRPVPEALTPEVLAELQGYEPGKDTVWRAQYARVTADSAGHFPIFAKKLKTLWFEHPSEGELGHADLAKVTAPTLVIAGDKEVIRLEHTVEIYRSIPKAELLIVPGTGHHTLKERAEWLNPIIRSFLDKEM